MHFIIKTFDTLTNRELYEILKLRSQIFIVEQGGVYQDLDDIDYGSIHLFCEDASHAVLAYLRLFPKPDEPGIVQLGRIVTRDHQKGYGSQLMQAAYQIAGERFHARGLYLTGRASALGFYEKCGFYLSPKDQQPEGHPYYKLRRTLSFPVHDVQGGGTIVFP